MKKKLLVEMPASFCEAPAPRPEPVSSKLTEVKAIGYNIVVEMLSQQEASCSLLSLGNEDSNQGYVRGIGPLIEEKAGLKVGDRVVLQGKYVPVPNPHNTRKMGVVNLHDIKAVLVEE